MFWDRRVEIVKHFFSEEKTKHIKYEISDYENEGKKEIFNIEYDPFTGVEIFKESFDNTKIKENYLNAQKEIYSKPTEIKVLQLDFTTDIHNDGNDSYYKGGAFRPDENILTVYNHWSNGANSQNYTSKLQQRELY